MIPIGDIRRPRGIPGVLYTIVALNIFAFYLEATADHPEHFIDAFALVPYNVVHGILLAPPSPPVYWLTILTSMFLHASILHIFFNMLFLLVFGPAMERFFGHIGFGLLYLGCGIVGGLTQIFASPWSHVPEIGASGAIAGVLGAYIVTFPTNAIETVTPIGCFPLILRLPAVVVIGAWAALQFLYGFGSLAPSVGGNGGVAYFAHIGGFVSGALVAGILGGRNRRARTRRDR